MADPATREQFVKAGRRVADRAQPQVQEAASRARRELIARGPDVAERATQRAVDGLIWGLAGRFGVLTAVIRPIALPVRNTAGTLARDLAKAAGGNDVAAASGPDTAPRGLPESGQEGGRAPSDKS